MVVAAVSTKTRSKSRSFSRFSTENPVAQHGFLAQAHRRGSPIVGQTTPAASGAPARAGSRCRVAAAVLGGLEVLVAIALLLRPTAAGRAGGSARLCRRPPRPPLAAPRPRSGSMRPGRRPPEAGLPPAGYYFLPYPGDGRLRERPAGGLQDRRGHRPVPRGRVEGADGRADTIDAEHEEGCLPWLMAGYLETNVADASEKSAADLEKTLAALDRDAGRLATLLRQAPPDLKAAKAVHDGLGSFDAGLDKLNELMKADRLQAMKEGFEGMETALGSTADQVDKVSGRLESDRHLQRAQAERRDEGVLAGRRQGGRRAAEGDPRGSRRRTRNSPSWTRACRTCGRRSPRAASPWPRPGVAGRRPQAAGGDGEIVEGCSGADGLPR